jgi:predicted transcriptional regulator
MTARLDLRLPADLKHNLALEAARDNRTVSAVTVLAIREYLDRRAPPLKSPKGSAE